MNKMINILHTNEIEHKLINNILYNTKYSLQRCAKWILDINYSANLLEVPIIDRIGIACRCFNKMQGKKLLPEHYTLSLGEVIVVPRGEKNGKM